MRMHSVFCLMQESHLRNSCATSGSLPLLCYNSGPRVATGDTDVSWHDSRRRASSSCLSCSMWRSSTMRHLRSAHASASSCSLRSSSRWAFSAVASTSLHFASLHSFSSVKCWNSNSIGRGGYVKERLELTPMGSFDIEQGGINSGPGSHGIPDGVQTDKPGFSLCAMPLELSGPGFWDGRVGRMNKRRSGVYQTGDGGEDWQRGEELRLMINGT